MGLGRTGRTSRRRAQGYNRHCCLLTRVLAPGMADRSLSRATAPSNLQRKKVLFLLLLRGPQAWCAGTALGISAQGSCMARVERGPAVCVRRPEQLSGSGNISVSRHNRRRFCTFLGCCRTKVRGWGPDTQDRGQGTGTRLGPVLSPAHVWLSPQRQRELQPLAEVSGVMLCPSQTAAVTRR